MNLSHIIDKFVFLLVNYMDAWMLLVFILVALASWRTAAAYRKNPLTQREADFAGKTAIGYVVSAVTLWLAAFILS